MKIKTLLAQAAKCNSEDEAEKLLQALTDAFAATRALRHLPQFNSESSLESDGPMVQVEFNRLISEHYVTMIRPEIRAGKLAIVIQTNNMLDGNGLDSRDYKVVDDMEEVFDADEDRTVADLATRAKEQAIMHHEQLIERVGVPHAAAVRVAASTW
jgi:hypothetical protein